jgi:hypothetical protein
MKSLGSVKRPHYIWPSGHPLILSKERQIEHNFFSNEHGKNVQELELVSLEQLTESLGSVKRPHYIWPSGHPLILSKERQIEHNFLSIVLTDVQMAICNEGA